MRIEAGAEVVDVDAKREQERQPLRFPIERGKRKRHLSGFRFRHRRETSNVIHFLEAHSRRKRERRTTPEEMPRGRIVVTDECLIGASLHPRPFVDEHVQQLELAAVIAPNRRANRKVECRIELLLQVPYTSRRAAAMIVRASAAMFGASVPVRTASSVRNHIRYGCL